MRKIIELPVEEIVMKWRNGASIRELGREYGVSEWTISLRIKEYYEKAGKEKPKKKKPRINIPIKKIIEDKKNGMTQREMEAKYGVSINTIMIRLNEYYAEKGQENPHKKSLTEKIELPVEEIAKKWGEGIKRKEIAEEYGVSGTTITKRVAEYCEKQGTEIIEKRKKLKSKKEKNKSSAKVKLPIEQIIQEREDGAELIELSEKYGLSESAIGQRINKYYEENNIPKSKILKTTMLVVEYLKKGLTPEQIRDIAKSSRVIIPNSVMEKAISEVEDTKNIRKKHIDEEIDK